MSLMFYLLSEVLTIFLARLQNCEKATLSFVVLLWLCVDVCLSVRLFFCPYRTTRFPMDGYLWYL